MTMTTKAAGSQVSRARAVCVAGAAALLAVGVAVVACSSDPAGGAAADDGRGAPAEDASGPVKDGSAGDGAVTEGGGGDAGPGVAASSCAAGGAGLTNCGGAGNESCCTSLPVTGGTFHRAYTRTDAGVSQQASPATVSSFRLDKYEVTVGRFRQFVSAWGAGTAFPPATGSGKHGHLNGGAGLASTVDGGYEPGWAAADSARAAPTVTELGSCGGNSTWTSTVGEKDNRPINCVTWFEAAAFCVWDGGFLPSEAEWGYAAAGGSEERRYPWGGADPGSANQYAITGCWFGPGACSDDTRNIAPVGSAPAGAGRWGQLDLAGNVFEWNLDGYYDYATPCADCADVFDTFDRVFRGGAFTGAPFDLEASYRLFNLPTRRIETVGFRCARKP
jgi:formylglycine-generating enzyme required for sulfatase activity